MQLSKPVEPRHALCGRPVARAVDDDRDLDDANVAMEAGPDAEDGRCRAHRQGRGQWAIERDLEPGSIGWIELAPVSAHPANTMRFHLLGIFLQVSGEVDKDAGEEPG
jgi:hypothetical protein